MDIIDIGLYASYVLIILCAVAAVVIPLVQSFGDPKSLIKSAIGLVALVVVFFISYALADSDAPGATATTAKLVGAGIITMYILFIGALVGIVYTEVSKMIK